jgi:hypothetical protein
MGLRVRETAGTGVTITQVVVTLTESSGATTVAELSSVEAFGAMSISANGAAEAPGIALTGPVNSLATVTEMTVRVTFIDVHHNTGSVQTSSGVRLALTGDWVNRFAIQTMPATNWAQGRVSFVQSVNVLTGELVSLSGFHLPLTGTVYSDSSSTPSLAIGGMPGGSSGCAIGIVMREFEFSNAVTTRASGIFSGRCPGTAFGNFEIQRAA